MSNNTSAFERNRDPILEKLSPLIKPGNKILELGSGNGDHSQYFASQQPGAFWQTSERAENFDLLCESIQRGHRVDMAPPLQADLISPTWETAFAPASFEVVLAINVIHIAKWEATPSLMRGVSQLLKPGGHLITYGPYRYRDQALEPSNAAFEQKIQKKYLGAGLRAIEEVQNVAETCQLKLVDDHPMPANNRLLVFQSIATTNS